MWWRRKKGKEQSEEETKDKILRYPNLETFQSWVTVLVRSLQLKEGEFTFIAAYGGLLLFKRYEGIAWIPYKQIQDVIKKIDNKELLRNTVFLGSLVTASVAHVAILPIILIDRSISGFYRLYSETPPARVQMYLHSFIDKVTFKKVKVRLFSKLNQDLPTKEKQIGAYATEIQIHLKFFDQVELSPIEKFSDTLKKFVLGGTSSKFSVPFNSNILILVDALQDENVKVELIDFTKEELEEGNSAIPNDEVNL